MQKFLWTVCVVWVLFLAGCLPSGKARTPRLSDDALIFSQAQQALDARDFHDAASLLQVFLREFPDSKRYTWGLQRMGEAMEGLLKNYYLQPLERGRDERAAREAFLASYGSYGCWKTDSSRVSYDGSHYRRLLADYPDSNIADEAAYRLVLLNTDPEGRPESIKRELQYFEEVLERYPTTSFRYEIFYDMAYRCHRLYELYSYSHQPGEADRQQAQLYREKAVYLYSLALKSPQHGLFAEKAWKNLQDLEDGRRLFP
ncbi:MAG: hypothetical protein FJ119_13790 [Deltaproteobacteria bacterium]|nr:hypothetical protein [Deltaproteobacteria bacterium]